MLGFDTHTIHSLLITGIFAVQVAVAYLALRKYTETKSAPWLFLFLAGSVFAAYSFFHALVVPDFVIFSDALFDIFEHYGLFLGSAAFLVGTSLLPKDTDILYRFRYRILQLWIGGNLLFIASFVFLPKLQEMLYVWIDYPTGFSGIFFLLASFFFFRRFRQSRERLDFYTAIWLFILAGSAIPPFFYEEWNVLWWVNHGIILLGGIVTLVGFLRDNEEEKKGDTPSPIPFYRRVGFKLAVLILAITITPLSLLGFYSFHISENALGQQAVFHLALLSKANQGHVDIFLYQLKRTVADFSSDGTVRRLAKEDTGEPLSQYLIKEKLPLDKYLVGINVIGSDGKVMASTHKTEIGKDESEDAYFIDGMKLAYGEALALDYGLSSHFKTTEPLIATVAPVTSLDDKQNVGVIVTYFKADNLSAILSRGTDEDDTLDVYLVNSKNLLMSKSRFAESEAILHQVIDTDPVRNCRENRPTRGLFINWRGESVYGASVCFADFGWTLVAEISEKEVDKSAETLKDLLVIAGLLLAVAVIFVALIASSRVINSLRKLSRLAQKINQNNLDDRIDIDSTDEIGELAKDLDAMRQTIKAREEDLKQSNFGLEKSTRELKEKVAELEEMKKAEINLLEDIEDEKQKVEQKVTERTRELKEEQARLLASINSLSFGFLIADMGHHILLKNKAILELFKLKENDEISIDRISEFFGEHFDVKTETERCAKNKTTCEIKEIVFGTKFLRAIIAPIIMIRDHEETIGYVLLLEDITEAKVMERSRDEFFAVASHELRTPLTAIRGNTSMILDSYGDKVDKDMKEMLDDINTSSVRLINVVNDFLEVSRLEQGNMEIKKEAFDMDELVTKIVRDIKTTIDTKKISLLYTPPAAPPPKAFADKNRTEQVLINLLGNAMKFTKQGDIAVSLETTPGFIKVSVADTGIGISEQNQARLFGKFQQAGEQMLARDVTQGTGLGLYISRLIMQAMGGEIKLEKSELGKGSTFVFTVPIAS